MWVTASLMGILFDDLESLPEGFNWSGIRLPSVGIFGHPVHDAVNRSIVGLTRFGVGGDEDGHWLLHRLGQTLYVRKLKIFPLVSDLVLTPQAAQYPYAFDDPSHPLVRLDAHHF